MKFRHSIPVAVAALALLATTTGCKHLESRDQLVKGIQAFKSAHYEEAIDHFQKSIDLDPAEATPRLYLATAYAQLVVPNLDTPENLKTASRAKQAFQDVLARNPDDITSLKQIASIDFNTKNFDEARQYQEKVIAAPNATDADKEPSYYTIGVIDWTQEYKNAVQILADNGLKDDGEGNPKKKKDACEKIAQQNTALVDEGLKMLMQANQIDPNDDSAMSYINLTYRRKADMECGNDAARKADIDVANQWSSKAMGTRKAKEDKKNAAHAGGVVLPPAPTQ